MQRKKAIRFLASVLSAAMVLTSTGMEQIVYAAEVSPVEVQLQGTAVEAGEDAGEADRLQALEKRQKEVIKLVDKILDNVMGRAYPTATLNKLESLGKEMQEKAPDYPTIEELNAAYDIFRQQIVDTCGDDTVLDGIDPLPMDFEAVYMERLNAQLPTDMTGYSVLGKESMEDLIKEYREKASGITSATEIRDNIAQFIKRRDGILTARGEIMTYVDAFHGPDEEQEVYDATIAELEQELLAATTREECLTILMGAKARVEEALARYEEAHKKPLVGISLNISETELVAGASERLYIIYDPADSTDYMAPDWSSSNEAVAIFDDGSIRAKSKGTAIIKAQVGNFTASCKVTVKSAEKYTVWFDTDLGDEPTKVTGIEDEKTIKLPTDPERDGYIFSGWYTEKNGQGTLFTESTPVVKNLTVYAYWVEESRITVDEISAQPYMGKACTPKPVVRDGEKILTLGKDYTLSYKKNVNAGTAEGIIKGKGNYNMSLTANFTITQKDITDDDVEITVSDWQYTGKWCKPKVVVKWGNRVLKRPADFDYYTSDGLALPGSDEPPVSHIWGFGNFTGHVDVEIYVYTNKQNSFVIDPIEPIVYSGEALEPRVRVYASKHAQKDGDWLREGVDYKISYRDNINAGTGKVIVYGIGEYSGTKTFTFKIQQKSIDTYEGDIELLEDAYYTGKALKPAVEVTYRDKVLTEGVDYTLKYTNNVKVATWDSKNAPMVTAIGKGNYTGKISANFEIAKMRLYEDEEGNNTISVRDAKYTGKEVKPPVVVKIGNKTLRNGVDYTVSYKYNIEVPAHSWAGGWPEVTVTGKGNYDGSMSKIFQIYEKSASALIVDKIPTYTYTGDEICPELGIYATKEDQMNAIPLSKGYYDVNYLNNVNAGTGKVEIVGQDVYGEKKIISFVIQKKSLNAGEEGIQAELSETTMAYTGSACKPTPIVTYNGKELLEGTDYTVKYSNNVNAAAADSKKAPTATITGKGNYTGKLTQHFRIYSKNISTVIVDTIPNKSYTGRTINPKVRVYADKAAKAAGITLTEGVDYELTYPENGNINAGTGTVDIVGKGEYGGVKTAKFKIVPKAMK